MTVLSSSGAAAAKSASEDYGLSRELSVFAFITVYLLGQTVGGIFCSPISEWFGRRTIYMNATAAFGMSSLIVATPDHVAGVFIGRFMQGVSAAIPATVAFGNFTDMFDAEVRIWVVYAYTLFGMSGLTLGPIYSSFVTATLNWRWVFYVSAIASAVSFVSCIFIRESNAAQLLQTKTEIVQSATGRSNLKPNIHTSQTADNPIQGLLRHHLYLPLTLLVTEPLVALCALLTATCFGLIYGLTESLTLVYTTPPFDARFNETTASLAFLVILSGEILNILPRIYDALTLKQYCRHTRRITPETKIQSFALACPALAIGLWIFAWTIPQRVGSLSWPISMLGLVFIGFAASDFSYVLFGYITDCYGFYAASAVSALSTARTLTAAVFPLFTTQMYQGLGNNIATSALAGVATLFCVTPWLFLRFGAELREKSRWAESGEDALRDENKHMAEQFDGVRRGSRCGSRGSEVELTA